MAETTLFSRCVFSFLFSVEVELKFRLEHVRHLNKMMTPAFDHYQGTGPTCRLQIATRGLREQELTVLLLIQMADVFVSRVSLFRIYKYRKSTLCGYQIRLHLHMFLTAINLLSAASESANSLIRSIGLIQSWERWASRTVCIV